MSCNRSAKTRDVFERYTQRFPDEELGEPEITHQNGSVLTLCSEQRSRRRTAFCLEMVDQYPRGEEVFGGYRFHIGDAVSEYPSPRPFDCFGESSIRCEGVEPYGAVRLAAKQPRSPPGRAAGRGRREALPAEQDHEADGSRSGSRGVLENRASCVHWLSAALESSSFGTRLGRHACPPPPPGGPPPFDGSSTQPAGSVASRSAPPLPESLRRRRARSRARRPRPGAGPCRSAPPERRPLECLPEPLQLDPEERNKYPVALPQASAISTKSWVNSLVCSSQQRGESEGLPASQRDQERQHPEPAGRGLRPSRRTAARRRAPA